MLQFSSLSCLILFMSQWTTESTKAPTSQTCHAWELHDRSPCSIRCWTQKLMLCLQLHKKIVLFYTLQWTRRSMYGMYGIFAYIHLVVFMENVGKYTMHGSYGYVFCTWRPLPSNYVGFSCSMFIDLSTWSSHDKRPDFRETNTNCQPFPQKKKTLRTLFSMVSSTLFRSRPSILGLLFHSKQIFMVR